MDRVAIAIALVVATTTKVQGDTTTHYSRNNGNIGDILKPPPPPPPLGNIQPVPFHGGSIRAQRQNTDLGYQYPAPPPPPPLPPSANFKFPAPFYRQYNFNFVPPPPQPFLTTPSPNMFQKVSSWLFPSQQPQVGASPAVYNPSPLKKECNPCNLVPWIPVIRYDLSNNKPLINTNPTYGPPSPTAISNNIYQYSPQQFKPFNTQSNLPVNEGTPHAVYGPPTSYSATPSSTYGPPSQTYTLPLSSIAPPTSTHEGYSTSYGISSSTYGIPSSTYGLPSSTYGSPVPFQETMGSDTQFRPVTPNYGLPVTNYGSPQVNTVGFTGDSTPNGEFNLPKVSNPSGFRNSYGEPITNDNALLSPYPVSATAAESSKIKTEILPNTYNKPDVNDTFTVAKPAPFSVNKGRNIHTLQPVALPNLSVSPLPPIFNARPFRPNTKIYLNNVNSINNIEQTSNIDILQKIPIKELSHSIEYPPTIVQAPVFDIKVPKSANQSKAYRYFSNAYPEDYSHDISSQASEDHIAATNNNNDNLQDNSFESTGPEFDSDVYDNKIPLELRQNSGINKVHTNHRPQFTDLRGSSDDVIDKFRTDGNLQSIDSPLLYLKPSAPHKDFDNFILQLSTPLTNTKDYEMYDDTQMSISTELPTKIEKWLSGEHENAIGGLLHPKKEEKRPKVVQIIIPYTNSNNDITSSDESNSQDWISASADESQGRKVPVQTTSYSLYDTVTELEYITSTEFPNTPDESESITERETVDPVQYNTHAILNDLYDVKEPPFDIIKLQQNIDEWTEQQYAKNHKGNQKSRSNGKFAYTKPTPHNFFTTPSPNNYVTLSNNYIYSDNSYDHEGSSSIKHLVSNDKLKNASDTKVINYNSIERHKQKINKDEVSKPHIYTAASSFRSTTTTPAPWGKLETSISPITKEKIYVVTAKPWKDSPNVTTWYSGIPFESKKTSNHDNDVSASDNLPFKSPRFIHRPAIASYASDSLESLKTDSSFGFSKTWHQSINELETGVVGASNIIAASDRSDGAVQDHREEEVSYTEDIIETTTAGSEVTSSK